ncbi:MAG: MFS transporter [Clostridiales bacterium]|nr:MFS transporter [Clostridiales bacterium]
MEEQRSSPLSKELKVFFAIVALTGFAMGMSDNVISNFFKDAYDVTAQQRGFLEFPREAPGVICFLVIALTSGIGDVRLSLIAKLLCIAGSLALGLFTPSFAVMSILIFINSLGNHIYIPLQDSIGLSIIGQADLGKRMGQYSAFRTAFMMLSSIIVFLGFRFGFFSFKTQIKLPFLIGAAGFTGVFLLYLLLYSKYKVQGEARKKQFQILVRKKYTLYYILAVLAGVHRQIMVVFGPWVLIEILSQQADTLAFLGIISSFLGALILPTIGRWIDRFGTKTILLAEGFTLILVYIIYGFMSRAFTLGTLAKVGLPVLLISSLFVFERLTMQFGIVRTAYLRSIAVDPADITPTLSFGLSMDHVVAISCAYLGGVAWNTFGPQYVFYIAATLSVLNVIVAVLIKPAIKAAPSVPETGS